MTPAIYPSHFLSPRRCAAAQHSRLALVVALLAETHCSAKIIVGVCDCAGLVLGLVWFLGLSYAEGAVVAEAGLKEATRLGLLEFEALR